MITAKHQIYASSMDFLVLSTLVRRKLNCKCVCEINISGNTFYIVIDSSSSTQVNVCNINEQSVKSFNFLSYFFPWRDHYAHWLVIFFDSGHSHVPRFCLSTQVRKEPMKKSALFDRKGKMPLQRFFKRKKRAKSAVSRINSYLITLVDGGFLMNTKVTTCVR